MHECLLTPLCPSHYYQFLKKKQMRLAFRMDKLRFDYLLKIYIYIYIYKSKLHLMIVFRKKNP